MKAASWVPWALAITVIGWVAAVLMAPVLPAWPAALVYGVSSLVCHQLPDRSLYWGAVQFAVCARCTGIYLGAAAAAAAGAFVSPVGLAALKPRARLLLTAGAVPTIVTVLAEWLGMWVPSHAVRLAAGVPLGATVVATVAMAVTLHYQGWLPRPDAPHRPRRP